MNVLEPQYEWDPKFMVNREKNKPPPAIFYAVGWDRDEVIFKNPSGEVVMPGADDIADGANGVPASADAEKDKKSEDEKKAEEESGIKMVKVKHYRRIYNDELENCKDVLPVQSPFNQYDMKKGQTRGAKAGFWAALTNNVKTDASGEVSTEKVTGRFKALIEVESKPAKELYAARK